MDNELLSLKSTLLAFICAMLVAPLWVAGKGAENIYELSLEELINLRVDSASGFTESLTETPVPVTVITAAMIQNSPALSLRDLLSQYVPGFTSVQDQNEYNSAFRGVYTSSQQKILILLNGKRINSRSYSNADPAFGISLDKLAQIEVIRGPGSSVYGNVALTAVINLKLKSAKKKSTFEAKFEAGSYGLKSLYTEWSMTDDLLEYLVWASFFETKGEEYSVLPQNDYSPTPANGVVNVRLDSFDAKPSTDLGFSIKGELWSSYITFRESHYIEPFSGGSLTGEAYDYRDYPQKGSNAPGADFQWFNLDAERLFELGTAGQISVNVYYASSQVAGSFVLSPAETRLGTVLWEEQTLGTKAKWTKDWESNELLFGLQYETNEVDKSDFFIVQNRDTVTRPFTDENPVLLLGSESVFSFFSELKHRFDQQWLLNIGARFDDKNRLIGRNVHQTSPRLALIYQGSDINLKIGYSRSFVDPPYWNRYTALASFRGSQDLKPEILESYQFSPEILWLENSLSTKFNFFYNFHSDFVFRNRDATADEPLFANSGKIETLGFEHEWVYRFGSNSVRLVATHQKVAAVEFYDALDDEIFNIPKNQFSLSWDTEISQQVIAQFYLQYLSSRLSPIRIANNNSLVDDPFPNQGVSFDEPEHRLPSVMLINAKVRWQFESIPLEISLSVQNLTDQEWEQGGSTIHPYPQTGRWAQVGISYSW